MTDALADFDRRSTSFGDASYHVYVAGTGPAIVVLPEIAGITPAVADYGRRLVAAGFATAQTFELVLDHFRQKLAA